MSTPAWALQATARRQRTVDLLRRGQADLVAAFSAIDGHGHFLEHAWSRPEGGGGSACVVEAGDVFERGGVNVSAVRGAHVPPSLAAVHAGTEGQPFFATGISLVLHPRNPFVPAFHANFRYFEVGDGERPHLWWFGGGADLTPAYPEDADVRHFHQALATWCGGFPQADYPTWKLACDAYFTIRHRAEMRGVGGVFFDELRPPRAVADPRDDEAAFDADLACVAAGIDTILPAYRPLIERHRQAPFGERERRWQLLRRGRYVEFNLVYDRGTLFGLQTGGHIEAILMSLPPFAHWTFDHRPEPGSREEAALEYYQPRPWVTAPAGGDADHEEDDRR
jgi:coproporphyrinogen III oxidase